MAKPLAELVSALETPAPLKLSDCMITGISEDSRNVRPGDLFVALPGARVDGAAFAMKAVARGALAVVAERQLEIPVPCLVVDDASVALARVAAAFYDYPTRRLVTIVVTGTNGKTSACHIARELLGTDSAMLLGTVENVARGISGLTTPSSLVIQAQAAQAVEQGTRYLILEASSAGIAQHRLEGIEPTVAAFTNLTTDHWAFHGGETAYREAKVSLFRALPADAVAVLNAEDATTEQIRHETSARVITYGIECPAELSAIELETSASGIACTLLHEGDRVPLSVPFAGRYQLSNALAALAIALSCGVDREGLVKKLAEVSPIPGRMQWLRNEQGRHAVVDYAHNPDALSVVLEQLRRDYERVILVLGAPGDHDLAKRKAMGRVSSQWAAEIILTSDNPRYEDPGSIMEQIASGIDSDSPAQRFVDRAEAIRYAVSRTRSNAVLLVAGKGHETVQWIKDHPVPHSDLEVLHSLGFRETPRPT